MILDIAEGVVTTVKALRKARARADQQVQLRKTYREQNPLQPETKPEGTMKEMTPKAPEGYEIDLEKSNFVYKKIDEWPTSWESLKTISGFFTGPTSRTMRCEGHETTLDNGNIFATKEQAEASKALAQITQLLKAYNGDWVPDWTSTSRKYFLCLKGNSFVEVSHTGYVCRLLVFDTEKKANHFLEHYKDLIEKARPLLGG